MELRVERDLLQVRNLCSVILRRTQVLRGISRSACSARVAGGNADAAPTGSVSHTAPKPSAPVRSLTPASPPFTMTSSAECGTNPKSDLIVGRRPALLFASGRGWDGILGVTLAALFRNSMRRRSAWKIENYA